MPPVLRQLVKDYGEAAIVQHGLKALGFPVFMVSTPTEAAMIRRYMQKLDVVDHTKG